MNRDRLPRVLLLYRTTIANPVMIPSVRLCGHLQMQALADAGKIEYRQSSIDGLVGMDVSWPDIVLLGRLDTRAELRLARRLKAAGKYLIYIMDDDLLNVPSNMSSASHYATREVKQNIREMLAMSDALLSPSPILMDMYAHEGMRRMLTEEPAVEPAPFAAHDPQAPVTIGFAGSIDRVSDVERVLKEALESIYQEYKGRVRFSFFGAIPSFARNLDAAVIPYENGYEAYRRRLNTAGWDIGLAPMMDTPFHRCKHYNKFCEYAAAGIVGIFSRHEPYVRLEENIGIGYFCENTSQAWRSALKALLDQPELRENLREQACAYAKEFLSAEVIAQRLLDEHGEIFDYRARQLNRPMYCRTMRIEQLYARFVILWQAHGTGTAAYIAKKIWARVMSKIRKTEKV